MTHQIIQADCLDLHLPDRSVDLVFCSPPYESARTYGIGFKLRGQEWVDWAVPRYMECLRVCRGLVAWVIEGQTRNFRWSATPALLMADLHRRGVNLRKPPVFQRVGIPGSGGPDWLRNDYEFIVCATSGKLPWSDNTAMGHPPRWAPGGEMSNRTAGGSRVNQWGHSIATGATIVQKNGVVRSKGKRPSHVVIDGRDQWGGTPHRSGGEGRNINGKHKKIAMSNGRFVDRLHTKAKADGSNELQGYNVPAMANPGNVIKCLVGGRCMGDSLCHENEAPFPEKLAEFFIRSFCPPGGTVLDPFSGSGTTAKVALICGRHVIASDIRQSQCELTQRRINRSEVVPVQEDRA